MVTFEFFKDKIGSKYTPNCTILKNILGGACPQTPLAKRMASPCAACRFATCKFPNLKKNSCPPPPLPNPGDAPATFIYIAQNIN